MSAPALPRAPAAGISSEAFRAGMRHLAGAVTVLAASGADGAPIGLAATAVCSLSAEPARCWPASTETLRWAASSRPA